MHVESLHQLTHARTYARLAGVLYLYIVLAGALGEGMVRGALIDSADPVATLQAIQASETLWRSHIFTEILVLCCDVALAVLFYMLLAPVGRALSLAAAFLRLAMVAISGVKTLFLLVPLLLSRETSWLSSFTPEQLAALNLLFLRLHGLTFSISLIFFGFCCLAKGWLIWRADYLPGFLGALLMLAGMCYLANSTVNLLAPAVSGLLFPWILLPCLIAELALALWLLIRGIDPHRIAPPKPG